jgi:hypothetical protein
MGEYQRQKRVVLDYYKALDAAAPDDCGAIISAHAAPGYLWRGYHPFNEITESAEVGARFWGPLKQSLARMQRRLDIFLAGCNETDRFASVWVASSGHLMGLFDAPWLGIAPTGKIAMLRYAEFHRVQGDRIAETAMFFDIPHLMMQAGLNPFPPQTGAHLVQPGPMTHDGLLFDAQDPEEGTRTLAAINAMIADMGTWNLGLPLTEELARTWNDDMLWWGPAGIGSTYTISRYAKQHAGPFRASFSKRSRTGHVCRIAEGSYGGFFGWPNFTAIHDGGFMGMPAGHAEGAFRVIDLYRREGDKLAENWIYIDLLHFWKTQGVDILARMQEVPRT